MYCTGPIRYPEIEMLEESCKIYYKDSSMKIITEVYEIK